MDGAIAMEERLAPVVSSSTASSLILPPPMSSSSSACEPLPLVVHPSGLLDAMTAENNTVGSMASSSSSASMALMPATGDAMIDDDMDGDDDMASAGGGASGMCGGSFAMGVVPEQNRSPTPLMMGGGTGESPESSVGAADDDSFVGGHSPQPSLMMNHSGHGSGAATGVITSAPRRSIGGGGLSSAPNAPQLPPDIDVLNDEIGDLLKAAVLTTIDDLRRRKARPNLKNIGHMMLRRHGCSPRQVEALLEFLVERDIVIKVDYKGQASYRNASKWKKGHILKGTIMNPAHISRLVLDVIAELERRLPTQAGVHPDDIEMLVLARAAQHQWPMNKQKFLEAITREVDLGRLQKLKNGFFRLNDPNAASGASSGAGASTTMSGPVPTAAHSNNSNNSGSTSGCNIISPLSIQRGPPSMVLPPSNRSSLGSSNGAPSVGSGLTPMKHSPNSNSFSSGLPNRKSPPEKHNRLSPPKTYGDNNSGLLSSVSGAEPSLKRQKMTTPGLGGGDGSGLGVHLPYATQSSSGFGSTPNASHSSLPSPNLQKLASMCRICSQPLSGPSPSPSLRGFVMGASSVVNERTQPETTLMCATCRFSVHSSCAGYTAEQAIRYRETGWMCPSCRTCTFCGFGAGTVPGDGMQLVVCDQCDRSYHMGCHIPALLTLPAKGIRWLCSACDLHPMSMIGSRFNRAGVSAAHVQAQQSQPQQQQQQQQPSSSSTGNGNSKSSSSQNRLTPNGSTSSVNGSSGPRSAGDVTPPLSGALNGNVSNNGNHRSNNGAASRTTVGGLPTPSGSGESTDEDISGAQFMPTGPVPPVPPGLPERIADWSISDVATYFRSAGFSDQARLVSEQEIDGAALLLLKRDDIIHELGFKLGPALKIYQIVAALQRKTVANTCVSGVPGADGVGPDVLVTSD